MCFKVYVPRGHGPKVYVPRGHGPIIIGFGSDPAIVVTEEKVQAILDTMRPNYVKACGLLHSIRKQTRAKAKGKAAV
jgi:hypothetical protein